MSSLIPTYTPLSELYASSSFPINVFEQRVQSVSPQTDLPHFMCRAPGRVNLIGEHIDYCGYGVLPMALNDKDVIVSISYKKRESNSNSSRLSFNISNVEDKKYGPQEYVVEGDIFQDNIDNLVTIDKSKHGWFNYVWSALKGVIYRLQQHKQSAPAASFDVFVKFEGRVPQGSGLSSSSALVCCSALAFMKFFTQIAFPTFKELGQNITKTEMAQMCIRCERFIGMESGGMDQSICFLGQANFASYIAFEPHLHAQMVDLPIFSQNYSIVVSNCLKEALKGATAEMNYNRRVVETRLGTAIIAKHILSNEEFQREFTSHKVTADHKPRSMNWLQHHAKLSFDSLTQHVKTYLQPHLNWSIEQIAKELEISEEQIQHFFLGQIPMAKHMHELKLFQRCLHVVSEASRVFLFKDASHQYSGKDLIIHYGQLMNASHESCRDLYEASCQELETLRAICLKHGSLGTRFSGAGWGGCLISLVPKGSAASFCDQLWSEYYTHLSVVQQKQVSREEVLFETVAGFGAGYLQV